MSTPYLDEIKLVAFNFAPKGWTMCNGQLLPINQNQALFSLLGTTYGGNGQTTFGLPDLRGRVPLHFGPSFQLGANGGEYNHTITISELPQHTHPMQAQNSNANVANPAGNLLANTQTAPLAIYQQPVGLVNMFVGNITNVGGSQAHQNQSPFLVMTWIIALQGIFPSRN